jgi:hypothetical protein
MAEDIQFNIGSKGADQAARGLLATSGASEKLRASMGSLSSAATGLQAAFAPLAVVFAGFKAIQGLASVIGDSNEAYKVQEKVARGATDAQLAFTSQMQRVLGVGDEVSLGLMKQAQSLGISQDKMDDVTLAAVGLSKATGAGLDESLKKVNQAIRGNASALGESIPGLQNLATEQQKLAAVSELANRGLASQKDSMTGLEGFQKRAANSFGDLTESIGAILAPIRSVISYGWAVFAETMQSVLVPAVELAKSAMGALPVVMDYVAKGIVGGITVLEVAFGNWGSIVRMEFDWMQLKVIQFAESIRHSFTVAIPTYASWFASNFVNMLSDAFQIAVSAAVTAAKAIGQALVNVWDWISSGFEGGISGLMAKQMEIGSLVRENFLKGFQASTEPLPEVMARQITGKEQELAERIGKVGARLGNEFSEKFNARMAAIQNNFEGFNAKVSLSQDKSAILGLGQQKAAAVELKSVESRLLTRGRADDPNAKVADNTAAAVKELEKLNEKANNWGSSSSNIPYTPGVVVGL